MTDENTVDLVTDDAGNTKAEPAKKATAKKPAAPVQPRTFYESEQGEEFNLSMIAMLMPGRSFAIDEATADRVKDIYAVTDTVTGLANSVFYFLNDTAFKVGDDGKRSDIDPLTSHDVRQNALLVAHDLVGVSLADAITELDKLPESDRAKVVADLFGVEFTAPAPVDDKNGGKGGKGGGTATKLYTPNTEIVQKVIDFLKARVADKATYNPAAFRTALFGKPRVTKPIQLSAMTVHKAITGHEGYGGVAKVEPDFEDIQKRLDKIEKEGIEKFTERLIAATQKAGDGSPLSDFTFNVNISK